MKTLRILVIGFVLGAGVATTAQVWGWGHTSSDRGVNELRNMRELEERRQHQEMIDRTLRRPC